MKYLAKSFTVPAGPSKSTACECCVWGRGEHAAWCPERTQEIPWWGYGKLVIDWGSSRPPMCGWRVPRLLDCCDTGMRSNGYAHDLDCQFHPSHKRFEIPIERTKP
jgi:hypothetical protein